MKLNNILIGLFLVIVACEDNTIENSIYSTDCVECMQYEYQQLYEDTIIMVTIDSAYYCLGDSILQYTYNDTEQFLEILNDNLLELITQNGYCSFLPDSIIIE